jgi:hypothetical protein
MVPPKPEVKERYLAAATTVEIALTGDFRISQALLAAMSEVKGLFNRSRKQDQPDWFLVWERLGLPSPRRLGLIVRDLNNWRSAVKNGAATEAEAVRERLQRGGYAIFLGNSSKGRDSRILQGLRPRDRRFRAQREDPKLVGLFDAQ